MRKTRAFRPSIGEKLEDRTVPSALLGRLVPSQVLSLLGGRDSGLGRDFGGSRSSGIQGSSSSTLAQDARLVQRAFQTFNASFLGAVSSLRQTATATTGPTADGLTAYNNAVAAAITTLNSSVSSALANLPNTGPALASTIAGYTSALQAQLQGAGGGLANSTNQAVLALRREANASIRVALDQSIAAIRDDVPAGSITSSAVQTYNQAARVALNTFSAAIGNAKQAAISAGTALDGATVSSAVSALQSSLTTAIGGLGTQFASSPSNPTSAVAGQLATLQGQLLAIAAPTAGNSTSARLFLRSVSSAISQNVGAINQAVATAIRAYNSSLL